MGLRPTGYSFLNNDELRPRGDCQIIEYGILERMIETRSVDDNLRLGRSGHGC